MTLTGEQLMLRRLDGQLLPVNIPADTEVIYIRVRWAGTGSSAVDLVKPDSSRITAGDCATDPDVYCEASTKEFWYALHNPVAGQWQVDIIDPTNLGDVTLSVHTENGRPFIQLTNPAGDTTTNTTLQINWTDSDEDDNAVISLYYDADQQDYNGTMIIEGLSEDDAVDEYVWDLSLIPTGHYYVYAQIDDNQNTPVRHYASGKVTIINPTYPATPTNLQATTNGSLLDLSWDVVADCTYTLHYTENLSSDTYDHQIPLTDTNQWIVDGSLAGKELKFAVQAIDSELRDSLLSPSITATVPSRPRVTTDVSIIEFGDVNPAHLSTASALVKNTGDTDLVITSLKFSGQDQAAFSTDKVCPFTIGQGDAVQVDVILSPNKVGSYVATFQIVSDDPETEIVEIGLSATLINLCEGDFDLDGDVDGSDLATFAADFGRTDCSADCPGDFDTDGDVDGSDLATFAADFGRTDCP